MSAEWQAAQDCPAGFESAASKKMALPSASIGVKSARLIDAIGRQVAAADQEPDWLEVKAPVKGARGGGRARVQLGTVPDFSGGDVKGAKLSGTTPGSPAEKAGIKAGDVVVELAGKKIENLYDYSFAIGALKAGVPVEIVVERDGKRVPFTLVPVPRE